MVKSIVLFTILAVAGFLLYRYYLNTPYGRGYKQLPLSGRGQDMIIQSDAFTNNGLIPSMYTCDGQNFSPPLRISNIPVDTQTLTLIVDDPDSPSGTFTHWVLFNIPPTLENIAANSVPSGAVQGLNDFGQSRYGGPCPGSGIHHYVFTVYALNISLNLNQGAGKADVLKAMNGHILSQSQVVGLYKRQ